MAGNTGSANWTVTAIYNGSKEYYYSPNNATYTTDWLNPRQTTTGPLIQAGAYPGKKGYVKTAGTITYRFQWNSTAPPPQTLSVLVNKLQADVGLSHPDGASNVAVTGEPELSVPFDVATVKSVSTDGKGISWRKTIEKRLYQYPVGSSGMVTVDFPMSATISVVGPTTSSSSVMLSGNVQVSAQADTRTVRINSSSFFDGNGKNYRNENGVPIFRLHSMRMSRAGLDKAMSMQI